MKLKLHYCRGNISAIFSIGVWLKSPCWVTGVSLVVKRHEIAIGRCMTVKKLVELIQEMP